MITLDYVHDFKTFHDSMFEYFKDHYECCEEARAEYKALDLDVDMLQDYLDKDIYNVFSIYDGDEFVGYFNVTITRTPLFKEPQATVDFLYILPDKRRSGYAQEAIKILEGDLLEEGISELNLMLPERAYSDYVAASLGYTRTSSIFYKVLGE